MNYRDMWSRTTNPKSGARLEKFHSMLLTAHNGKGDIEKLLSGPYGEAFTEMKRIEVEYEAPTPETYAYLDSFDLVEKLHDDEDYYTRWAMYLPKKIANSREKNRKYPLFIITAGPDSGRFSHGLYKLAAKEGFLYMCPQNTNWDSVSRILDKALELYPVDKERVYITGFSYGGYQATSCVTHVPWKYAAAVPCGNDIFRPYDSFYVPYTEDELATFRGLGMPFFQIVGEVEASNFVPLNDWHPRAHWGGHDDKGRLIQEKPDPAAEPYKDPRADPAKDPTINKARRLADGTIINTPPSAMSAPPEGEDRHLWMLGRLNTRLSLLGCAPRDVERCLAYLDTPEDKLHHILGFYGDKEDIRDYLGVKHYMADIYNEAGVNMFRYCCIENHPHIKGVFTHELAWEFVRQFRRDSTTGRIVVDPYVYQE